jgi:hypothetical protein
MLDQTLPASDYEVIVVENGARTGAGGATRSAARRHGGHRVRFVHDATPGLLTGRHRGALEARGDILVFADDDIDASPAWLSAILDTFTDPEVHLVGGRNLPRYETPPPAWVEGFWYTPPFGGRACIYLSLLDLGDQPLSVDANYVWGLNFGIRRKTLFELHGFHPDNIPDHLQHYQGDGETGLTMKANSLGRRAVYQPRALVHHRIPAARLTVDYFCRRAFYQGVCDSFTAIRRDPGGGLAEATESSSATVARPWYGAPPPRGPAVRASDWLAHRVLGRHRSRQSAAVPTFDEVLPLVEAAQRAGYEFHQNAVRRSPRLLAWVLRADYWDYRLPVLEE